MDDAPNGLAANLSMGKQYFHVISSLLALEQVFLGLFEQFEHSLVQDELSRLSFDVRQGGDLLPVLQFK